MPEQGFMKVKSINFYKFLIEIDAFLLTIFYVSCSQFFNYYNSCVHLSLRVANNFYNKLYMLNNTFL